MLGEVNSAFQFPICAMPGLTYIWANQGSPSISYTYTVNESGYYLGIAMRGDSGYTCSSTGLNTTFITGIARRLVVSTFECITGDTCTVAANNYSGNTNCRTEAALFKLDRKITLLSILYNAGANDISTTYSYTFAPGKYLVVYGQCGNTSSYNTVAVKTDVSPSGTQLYYNISEQVFNNSGLNMQVALIEVISGNLKISNGGSVGTAGGLNMVVFSIS